MKKYLLTIVSLFAIIGANAQCIEIYKNNTIVARYTNSDADKYKVEITGGAINVSKDSELQKSYVNTASDKYRAEFKKESFDVQTIVITDGTSINNGIISKGCSKTMTATTEPAGSSNSVTWTITDSEGNPVTDPAIDPTTGEVTVSSSAATGTYIVTATANDLSGMTQTYTVNVTDPITSITFKDPLTGAISTSTDLAKGYSKDGLIAIVEPSTACSTMTWSVSPTDGGVTVDPNTGKITATNAASGSYTITATAADGSGKTASYTVNVTDPVTNLSFTSTDVMDGSTPELTTVPTTGTTNNFYWTIANSDGTSPATGATIDPVTGKVSATTYGKYLITAVANDGTGTTTGSTSVTIGPGYVVVGNVKWATMNVGATSVADSNSCGSTYSFTDASTAVQSNMGENWRVPTLNEFTDLKEACGNGNDWSALTPANITTKGDYTKGKGIYRIYNNGVGSTVNGVKYNVNGYLFVTESLAVVFFPVGNYWTSGIYSTTKEKAYRMVFESSGDAIYEQITLYSVLNYVRAVSDVSE